MAQFSLYVHKSPIHFITIALFGISTYVSFPDQISKTIRYRLRPFYTSDLKIFIVRQNVRDAPCKISGMSKTIRYRACAELKRLL